MHSSKALNRVEIIVKKIGFINNIAGEKGSVINALEDEQNSRASIFMHLTSIAELDILSHFEKQDIKGSYELRNFIAHDYEGIDFHIVEAVIKERLPIVMECAKKALISR